MNKTTAIITNVDNFKENHLLISVYSSKFGKRNLVVFGGKSKKNNSNYVKGVVNEIEFNEENNCLNSNVIQSYNWFSYDKHRLKTVDYICFLINKILFLQDEKSKVVNYYNNLISRMNEGRNYISELSLVELEILRSSGYQPDLNEKVLNKIFSNNFDYNVKTNEELIIKIGENLDSKYLFFDFLGRVITRVLINLHIHLPFSRNEIIKKN